MHVHEKNCDEFLRTEDLLSLHGQVLAERADKIHVVVYCACINGNTFSVDSN